MGPLTVTRKSAASARSFEPTQGGGGGGGGSSVPGIAECAWDGRLVAGGGVLAPLELLIGCLLKGVQEHCSGALSLGTSESGGGVGLRCGWGMGGKGRHSLLLD